MVVDKPAGWTSHDVVAKSRGLLGTRKVGHAGTLDPDATGVLLLGVGRATKLLRFLSPLEPGLAEICARFKKVMTVEINYSDPADLPGIGVENRRRAQLAMVLRERLLVDVDCWSMVRGQPFGPGEIADAVRERLGVAGSGERGVA